MMQSANCNRIARNRIALLLIAVAAGVSNALAQGDPPRAFDPATAAVRAPGTTMRIDLIGDSTQTNNAGYGRGFCANLTAKIDCVNMAKGGASTKTFREQGLWERSLQTRPDYMLIQFGHNDMESKDHNPRQTTMAEYEVNLRKYVDEARAAGIKPVLVTPLTRRYFETDGKIHSDLLAHSETMKKVAVERKVPLIDLQADSIAYLAASAKKKATPSPSPRKTTTAKPSSTRHISTGRVPMPSAASSPSIWEKPFPRSQSASSPKPKPSRPKASKR
jgi:lysophospholipase L1-like esterase